MKKLLLVAILMLALVFTVVACNNDKPDNDTTVGETTVEVTPGTTAEPDPDVTDEPVVTEPDTTEAPVTTQAPDTTAEPPTTAPVVTTEPATTEAPVDPSEPVWIIDGAGLAAAGPANAATVELNDAGYASFTATGGDPWVQIAGNIGEMPEYMAIRYRTNTTQSGEFFISSSAGAEGGKSFVYNYNANSEWNLMIFHLPTVAPYMTERTVGHIRFDFYTGGPEDGAFLDVEYVGFFNSAEYAQAYDFEMHKAPAWGESGFVTHVSFDELDKYAGTTKIEGVFTPGQSAGWDGIVNLPDFSVDTLRFWGWTAATGELGQFGYQINGGTPIYDDAWTYPEDMLVHAPAGSTHATRMAILIPLAGLEGENNVRALYKNAEGKEACIGEFTVNLPANATNLFQSNASSNAADTDLKSSDLAGYFDIAYGANDPHKVIDLNGVMNYNIGGFNAISVMPDGMYALSVKDLVTTNPGFSGIFVRALRNANPEKQFYGQDGNDAAANSYSGSGIYIAMDGADLRINVKSYVDGKYVPNIYKIAAPSNNITVADNGSVVYILSGDKLVATIAVNGTADYGIDGVAADEASASATLSLCDGTVVEIENAILAASCNKANSIGAATRGGGNMSFSEIAVKGFTEVEIPEMVIELPRENIALGKPVSSNSVENETNIPENATDGDESTRFGALPNGEVKLIVDLEDYYALSDMKVVFENASWNYEILVSADGENYTKIYADGPHGATTKKVENLDGIVARYIMFNRLPDDGASSYWFSIYELYVYGEKTEYVPETPANEIKVTTTDTYTWVDVVTFTADATGTYTFTLPAGLGAWDVSAYDNFAGDPYVDYYANENGATFSIGLTEGETTTFYVAATTKADWTITWEYTEGEVEPDTEPSDLTTIEPVIGENTVTVTDADMAYGAIEGTLTVDKAGQYSIVAADFMGIFYIDGMQQRGSAWLEPGTYNIALVIYAAGTGTYNYTLTVEYPPVPGSEDLPHEWIGDVTVDGAHDVWYTYTADQDGILVITYPEGNWISGIGNKTDAAYSVTVSEGETVKFNIFGSNAGTYSIKMVKFVSAEDKALLVDETEESVDKSVLFLEEGTFSTLTHTGIVEFVGDSVQFVYDINGVVSDPIDAIEANAFSVVVPVDALERGGNLIKIGVVIDGLTVEYFWEYTVVVEYDETETDAPETETQEPAGPAIFDGTYHANVDHINGKGPAGAASYAGLGSSVVNSDGSTPVRNAADDGIVVNEDYTVSIGGWMAVDGGINHYAYTVNGGELIAAVGGTDGEPLPDYFKYACGIDGSLKNGMFNGGNMVVADLSAYEGQTVTVTFYAVPEAAQDTVAPIVTIEGLVVPEILEAYPVSMDTWTVSGHVPQIVPNAGHSHSAMVVAGGIQSGALLHQGSVGIGEIDLSQYSKIVVYYGIDNTDVTLGRYNASANNRIMMVSADTNMTNSPADDTIIAGATYEPSGWGLTAFEIDLTGVDYSGPVFVTYDTLPGTFMLIGAIELYA